MLYAVHEDDDAAAAADTGGSIGAVGVARNIWLVNICTLLGIPSYWRRIRQIFATFPVTFSKRCCPAQENQSNIINTNQEENEREVEEESGRGENRKL